jgi:molecular chaperone GrpE
MSQHTDSNDAATAAADLGQVAPGSEAGASAPASAQGPGEELAPAAAPVSAPAGLDPAFEALQKERDELFDRLLRKTAEFDNFRKRVERDRKEMMEWAAADVLAELLAVLDDFDRALAADAPPEAQAYRAGVELIHRQLTDLIRKRGVTPIEALGADFDPHVHQAVAYEESPGARDGEVIGVLAKGYKLGDRLLRPALVKVAKAS